jgi:hypothetical protein
MRSKASKVAPLFFAVSVLLSAPARSIDTRTEEAFCSEIGFKVRSKEFANCVLEFLGRAPGRSSPPLELKGEILSISKEGTVLISVNSSIRLSSLKVNGIEEGSNESGKYLIKRLPPVNQVTTYEIVARDELGRTSETSLTVNRVQEAYVTRRLTPLSLNVKSQSRNAVAIIIGVENYRRVPSSEFSSSDAEVFYEYAVRALGIPQTRIKILVDDKADRVGIRHTLDAWLPSVVLNEDTELFFFFSGHGLPSSTGDELYILPWDADRLYLSDTAISNDMIFDAIEKSGIRKSFVMLDSCYSGMSRTGETLLAGARPISVKAKQGKLPEGITLLSASSPDEVSYSSRELKHGIFSFHLMRGLEGDADKNKDKIITSEELFEYIQKGVRKDAAIVGSRQNPALEGDRNFKLSTLN